MKNRTVFLLFLPLILAGSACAQFQFTLLDNPGFTLTNVRGINNRGAIVGAYRVVPPRHALLISKGQYIPLAPNTILGSHLSEAYKINNRGDVVQTWVSRAGLSTIAQARTAGCEGMPETPRPYPRSI